MILDKKYKEPPIGVIGAGAWGTVISKLQLTIKWHIFTVILPLLLHVLLPSFVDVLFPLFEPYLKIVLESVW